jgi:mxaK protein
MATQTFRFRPGEWWQYIGGRGALLAALLVASGAVFLIAGYLYVGAARTNAAIDRLRAGSEVEVDAATAPQALLEAQAAFLLYRDQIQEAQPYLDQAAVRADPETQVRMLYNMANARLRAAMGAIHQGAFDKAIPLVMLAKSEYRIALRFDPENWDAKYNLDVAMRLVRDLPQGVAEEEEKPLETPEKLWTDLPGVPKGLP